MLIEVVVCVGLTVRVSYENHKNRSKMKNVSKCSEAKQKNVSQEKPFKMCQNAINGLFECAWKPK